MTVGIRTVAVLVLSVAAALAVVIGATEVFAATRVSPSNMNGWAFQVQSPDGSGTFVTGPASPPLGSGSARLFTGTNGNLSTAIHNSGFVGTQLNGVTRLEYSSYSVSSGATISKYPLLTLDLSTPSGPDELIFDPAIDQTQTPQLNAWQTWNALTGSWRSPRTNGTSVSIGAYITAFSVSPGDITIVNGANWGIRLEAGPASTSDVFDENVDNFTIGINGVDTTYDFEPDVATTPTSTFTPTATPTPTSTPTPTPTATATPCPGACPPTSTFTPTATHVSVGGIAEQPDVSALPTAAASSGRNYTMYIVGVAGAGLAALGAGAWATWRRRRVN